MFLSLLETRTGLLWCFPIPYFILGSTDVVNVILLSYQSQLQTNGLFAMINQVGISYGSLQTGFFFSLKTSAITCQLVENALSVRHYRYMTLSWNGHRLWEVQLVLLLSDGVSFWSSAACRLLPSSWLLLSLHQQKTTLLGVTIVAPSSRSTF